MSSISPSFTARFSTAHILSLIIVFVLQAALGKGAEKKAEAAKLSLTVTSVERMLQYPPPPAPEKVFVVTAGGGRELVVISLKVINSAKFEDYKDYSVVTLTNGENVNLKPALFRPLKSSEVWDKLVVVFLVKGGGKIQTLHVGKLHFDLSKAEEPK